jgi:hypothetical protein
MKIKVFFAWYDLWIGAYWDRKERVLYVCPLPTIAIAVKFTEKRQQPTPTHTSGFWYPHNQD